MSVLDGSIANVALPTIGRDLHASAAESIWIVNAFQLAVAISLLTFAALGQARGLKLIYRCGVVSFTLGSLLCALAPTLPALVGARFLQGLGASATMAMSPALISLVFPREQLGRALALNSLVAATMSATAPTLGGAILAVLTWPWLFAINIPLATISLLLGRGTLPDVQGHRGKLDPPSALASAFGFGAMIYGLDGLARGQNPVASGIEFVAGLTAFMWFLHRQPRLHPPLFDVALYAKPVFALASATSFGSYVGYGVGVVVLPFYLQVELGFSPLHAGLLTTAWPVSMALTAPFSGRLSDRYPAGILATLGLSLATAALLGFARQPSSLLAIVLLAALCGVGFGLFQVPNNRDLLGSVETAQRATAGSVLAAMRTGGLTLGAAVVAIGFAAFGQAVSSSTLAVAGVRAAVPIVLIVAAACTASAAIASGLRLRER
jgi:MFS transporter, DHA2 family, multidrug resistance protein